MKDIFTSYFAQAIVLLANFVGGVLAARRQLGVAPLALFTPSVSDISFVAGRLKDMVGPGQEPETP
ncbi:MAG TPA: hypothetical protein VEK12_01605 [Alphaproteobacteria bacterium]|nr:hypothetical protein [Alphaproteobacteria bacterium]